MSEIDPPPRAVEPFITFVAILRANGFAVAPEQTTAFLSAIVLLGPRDPEDIRRAGLATLAPAARASRRLSRFVRHPFPRRGVARPCRRRRGGCGSRPGRSARRGRTDQRRRVERIRPGCDSRRSACRTPLRPGRNGRSFAPSGARSRSASAEAAELPASARAARAPWSTCAARCGTRRATTARSSSCRDSSAGCGRARCCCSSTSPAR